jgi:hypothetical protein
VLVDVGLGKDDRLVLRHQRQRIGRLLLLDAGDDAAIERADDQRLILLGHHGAGVDDVRQQVIEVGPVAAGDVGADLAAGAEQRVALLAGLGEHGPAKFEGGASLGAGSRSGIA